MIKKIGIIASMQEELLDLVNFLNPIEIKNILKTDFYICELFKKKIILARSGIGKVNAAACTQALINLYNTDFIINIGVAGAINNKLNIGDIIIAEDLVQYDFDTSVFNKQIGLIPRLNKIYFESDKSLINLVKKFYAKKDLPNKINKIYFGRIASGDKFISNQQDKDFIKNKFNAYCVEMEGAAISQVCYLNNISSITIRTIIDKSDQDAPNSYKKFLDSISKNYLELIKYLIQNI